jgi:hypothetical protein
VTEAEARALVAALDTEFSRPSEDSWVLSRRAAVESYSASQHDDGSWRVTVLWEQGDHRFGYTVKSLADPVVVGQATPEQAATDLRMFCVEEPHAPEGETDESGRVWIGA